MVMKRPPSLVRPVAPVEEADAAQTPGSGSGMQVSQTTLRIEMIDGQHVAVREGGAIVLTNGQETNYSSALLGQIRWEDLRVGHVIGEGQQAKVRKVKHRHTGIMYAMKSIPLTADMTPRALQLELGRFIAPDHPNVVSYKGAFYIDGSLKILMEYLDLGTLHSIIKTTGPLPYPVLSLISRQILEGLAHLHAAGIIHRDIKPSNLLVNSAGQVKISDFGVSTILIQQQQAQTVTGSTAYMSPERVRGENHDARSDIWSVGLTVAQCALGVFPFWTGDGEDAEPNPFKRRLNMFDLSAMLADGSAKVDFDVLIPLVEKFAAPNTPRPIISEAEREFVAACMQQSAVARPDCRKLLSFPFITSPPPFPIDLARWLREHGVQKIHAEGSGGQGRTPVGRAPAGRTRSPTCSSLGTPRDGDDD
eukprot:TRINITY_DN9238_c0_g1_i1.p1 TRINITY_DN9238_c0_g1~~TRINITY_DN9238_c0_g1_i1.p1  ORF type:complete len:420 (+),score=45.17 TRINITY_DN9238_c0_g1_i1:64-1323(+)